MNGGQQLYGTGSMGGQYSNIYNPTTGEWTKKGARPEAGQNWLTDPEAPWNTWAQNLEGYLQDWVSSQRKGLQADLRQQNIQAGQTAIGQGLYQGTYTTSLPAEQLARMVGQNTQNYAGAMSGIQGQAMQALMSGQQRYGSQQLAALLAEMQMKAEAEAGSYGFGDFMGDFLGAAGTAAAAKLGFGCFAEDTPIKTSDGWKEISEIEAGNLVINGDAFVQVKEVFDYDTNPTVMLNGIETTNHHPFVMADGTLRQVRDLNVGDVLSNGVVHEKANIRPDKRLYNLEVVGHRFCVGKNNLLVHDGREVRG